VKGLGPKILEKIRHYVIIIPHSQGSNKGNSEKIVPY
jgi:hypothetical protein